MQNMAALVKRNKARPVFAAPCPGTCRRFVRQPHNAPFNMDSQGGGPYACCYQMLDAGEGVGVGFGGGAVSSKACRET